jgi:hypothetical protein
LQSILFQVCECASHLSFHPAHCFPNHWKFDGDYPPDGGQRNSFFVEFTRKRRESQIWINRGDFGLRWQSAAATSLFECVQSFQSGVALRFPPQSKKNYCSFSPLREDL